MRRSWTTVMVQRQSIVNDLHTLLYNATTTFLGSHCGRWLLHYWISVLAYSESLQAHICVYSQIHISAQTRDRPTVCRSCRILYQRTESPPNFLCFEPLPGVSPSSRRTLKALRTDSKRGKPRDDSIIYLVLIRLVHECNSFDFYHVITFAQLSSSTEAPDLTLSHGQIVLRGRIGFSTLLRMQLFFFIIRWSTRMPAKRWSEIISRERLTINEAASTSWLRYGNERMNIKLEREKKRPANSFIHSAYCRLTNYGCQIFNCT